MIGLSDSQVNKSKQDFGTNALAKKETESLWSMFIGAFDDIWIKEMCIRDRLWWVLYSFMRSPARFPETSESDFLSQFKIAFASLKSDLVT